VTFQIREPGELLSAEQLATLESELGARLPEQYRQFLVANNGGVPHPNVTVDIEGLTGTPTDVQEFFGIGLKIESSNITWHVREVSERLPENSVPTQEATSSAFSFAANTQAASFMWTSVKPA
jgi:hypothetical protein